MFELLFSLHNHFSSKSGNRTTNSKARKLSHLGPSEPIHRISTNLKSKLSPIQHSFFKRISLNSKFSFSILPSSQKLLQNIRQKSFPNRRLHKIIPMRSPSILIRSQLLSHLRIRNKRRITQIMSPHNRRIQTRKIQRSNRHFIEISHRVQYKGSFKFPIRLV